VKKVLEKNIKWDELDTLIDDIVAHITLTGRKFDLILSLNRGGLIPGTMLSHRLGVRHAVMSIESYSGKKRGSIRGGTCISASVYPKKKHINILIVDDIADSGKSFEFAIKKLKKLRWSAVYFETAALYWKPKSSIRPTYIGGSVENNVWINYPWERWPNYPWGKLAQ
jgi:uncharacterized protein